MDKSIDNANNRKRKPKDGLEKLSLTFYFSYKFKDKDQMHIVPTSNFSDIWSTVFEHRDELERYIEQLFMQYEDIIQRALDEHIYE